MADERDGRAAAERARDRGDVGGEAANRVRLLPSRPGALPVAAQVERGDVPRAAELVDLAVPGAPICDFRTVSWLFPSFVDGSIKGEAALTLRKAVEEQHQRFLLFSITAARARDVDDDARLGLDVLVGERRRGGGRQLERGPVGAAEEGARGEEEEEEEAGGGGGAGGGGERERHRRERGAAGPGGRARGEGRHAGVSSRAEGASARVWCWSLGAAQQLESRWLLGWPASSILAQFRLFPARQKREAVPERMPSALAAGIGLSRRPPALAALRRAAQVRAAAPSLAAQRSSRSAATHGRAPHLPQMGASASAHAGADAAAAPPPPPPPPAGAPKPQRPQFSAAPNPEAYSASGITQDLYAEVGRPSRRVRQHVNPLVRRLQVPAPPLDWPAAFADPGRPLALDVGSGYGRFLLALLRAPGFEGHNALGLEVRGPVVERAGRWADALGLGARARFALANATVSLPGMLDGYAGGVDLVAVQFPDPHWKKKARKRRVVQPALAAAVAALLRPGGRLLLQSDVLEVAEDMRARFEEAAGALLEPAPEHAAPGGVFHAASPPEEAAPAEATAPGGWAAAGWLVENPLGVPTEREVHVLAQGLPV